MRWSPPGLVMLTGVGGMTSFGQAAFVGMGAYATAWICTSPTAAAWLGSAVSPALLPWAGLAAGPGLHLRAGLGAGRGHAQAAGPLPAAVHHRLGPGLYYLFGNMEFLGGQTGITGVPPLVVAGVRSPRRARWAW
jgi:branched-chain amino acid transport system permease protein